MAEWWTYSLGDFLMFSPRTYWRLVEQYNRALWPWQALPLAAGLASLRFARMHARGVLIVLALAWLWVAWAFHWERHAAINLAAPWFAGACAVQAALLLAAACKPPGLAIGPVGRALVVAGLVLYPFAGFAFGRSPAQAEVFGAMPDPTALVTLGFTASRRTAWLAAIPALTLAAGLALHVAMAQ